MQANYESEDELVDVSIDENYSGSQTKNEDILNESLSGSPRKKMNTFLKNLEEAKNKMKNYQDAQAIKQSIIMQTRLFDDRGHEIPQDDDADIDFEKPQIDFLKKLNDKTDPKVPIFPTLDSFYSANGSIFDFYEYSIECCSEEYILYIDHYDPIRSETSICHYITQLLDDFRFEKFFVQIPTDDAKKVVLDSLILNSQTFAMDSKADMSFCLIEELFENKALDKLDWHMSDILVFNYFKSLGLIINKFEQYFPDLIGRLVMANLDYIDSVKVYTNITEKKVELTRETTSLLIFNFMHLLAVSLEKKDQSYQSSELDFIFIFLAYTYMDSSYSADLIASNKLESIYSSIVRIYKQKSEYNAKKAAMLSDKLISLLNVPLIELINMNFANASTTESMNKQEFIFKCNNIFHRFLTLFDLINSAEYRLKGLCNRLASIALSNLIQAANMEKFEPTRQEDDLDEMLDSVAKVCSRIFKDSSYTMFVLIGYLSVVSDGLVFDTDNDPDMNDTILEKRIDYLDQIKEILTNSRINVQDKGMNGRAQVKVIMSYLSVKCEVYMSKLVNKLPSSHAKKHLSCWKNRGRRGFLNQSTTEDRESSMTSQKICNKDVTETKEDENDMNYSILNSSQLPNL